MTNPHQQKQVNAMGQLPFMAVKKKLYFLPIWLDMKDSKMVQLPDGLSQDACVPGIHPQQTIGMRHKQAFVGTSLVVPWLRLHAPNAVRPSLIPVREPDPMCYIQLRVCMPQPKPRTVK